MKAPSGIERLSFTDDQCGTYPPIGFLPVWDAELGNGDHFGLYWPYGREQAEPVVCDMLHDQWGMTVAFSEVSIFLDWLDKNDWMRGEEPCDDTQLVTTRFQAVKTEFSAPTEQTIVALSQICHDFPESSEYWYALSMQQRRLGDVSGSFSSAVRAYTSNWAFGVPNPGVLRMLQNGLGKIDDPLIERSERLTAKYGGEKENSNYPVLKECIVAYLESSTPVLGLLLNQNYGYMMSGETVSFQERYDFERARWRDEHISMCERYLGDSRTSID